MPTKPLHDKVALVTGAGRRIGRVIALTLARAGAHVVVNYNRSRAEAQATVREIAALGVQAGALHADVSRPRQVEAMFRNLEKRFGRLDVLVNNAAVFFPRAWNKLTEEDWDHILGINLKGAFFCCQAAARLMMRQRSGAIINISSMAVITTYPYVAYKATKSAMVAFTEQLAYQNAQYGIRANVILPGLMDTPMAVDTRARTFKKTRAEVAAERDSHVPLRGKMGTGWDVANAALFLASDEANFITGVTLPVDGGASVKRG